MFSNTVFAPLRPSSAAQMKGTEDRYRYCACQHRLTIHRRQRTGTTSSEKGRGTAAVLVCEACGNEMETRSSRLESVEYTT